MAEAPGAPGAPGTLRVLLVEDDASIRRFVALALEGEPLQLVESESLAEARAQLAGAAPFDVVIADLMLGDGNGIDLLQELGARPGITRIAFSAGIDRTMRSRLEAMGVTELLAKPVSVSALLDAITRAAAARTAATGAGGGGADTSGGPAELGSGGLSGSAFHGAPGCPSGSAADAAASANEDGAGAASDTVARFFGGDHGLFALYRQQCLAQFAEDLRQGDASLAAGDLPATRRLAHSLKSVLTMLGDEPGAACARSLELAAAAGDAAGAATLWRALGGSLHALRAGVDRL